MLQRVWQRPDSEARPDPPSEQLEEVAEHQHLCRARLDHLVEVREPLVLISQMTRSGGTLLTQLFDGHPECHAHPWELQIGYPRRSNWPRIELGDAPDHWFEILNEEKPAKQLRRGYRKPGPWRDPELEVFPFLFLPSLRKAIFDHLVESWPIERERDVLDAYMSSYFNAWLDNHNLYTGPKKVVTGFAPRMSTDPGSLERFFAVYPDGVLISIVRDPCGWFASANKLRPQYADPDRALALWRRSAEAGIEARERFGERVLLLTYEQLVLETERTMSLVAERIGITFSPMLLRPTFNVRPIRANSSHAVERYGILSDRVDGYRTTLDAATIARVEELAGDLYERAAARSLRYG